MKIVDVKTHVLGTAWRNLTFVRVLTDEGLEGFGEVRMLNHTDALLGYFAEAVPNHILGSDPFNVEDLVQRMFRNDFARVGEIAMSAISTIEIACWDIMGKALGQPVYKLLGGAVRNRIKAYANGWYTVERTPQEFHAAARRVLEKGYQALKFDPFGEGFYELDRPEKNKVIGLVEAVYDAVGPNVEILIEMHGRFNPATAVEMARELERFNDFAEDWVKAAAPGNPEVIDGYFALPQAPGLGVKLDEAVIQGHPQQRIFFNLFAKNWHRRQAVQSDSTTSS